MKKHLIIAVIICSSFLTGRWTAPRAEPPSSDTTYIHKTTYVDRPVEKSSLMNGYIPTVRFFVLSDTTFTETVVRDTVYLPREVKYYEEEDGRLRLWVSGYSPALDRYELDNQTAVVRQTIRESASRWSLSVSGGYGISRDGLSPYLGLGVSYDIYRFPTRESAATRKRRGKRPSPSTTSDSVSDSL